MSDDLDTVKAKALAKIEADAAAARAKIATPGAPYAEKLAEAMRYPADGPWPFLDAEAARLGGTRETAANMIRGRAAETAIEMADIEATRGRARDAVKAATSMREAVAAVKSLEW